MNNQNPNWNEKNSEKLKRIEYTDDEAGSLMNLSYSSPFIPSSMFSPYINIDNASKKSTKIPVVTQ